MSRRASRKSSSRRNPHPLAKVLHLLFWLFVLAVCAGAGGATGALLAYVREQGPIDKIERYDPPQVTRVFDRSGRNAIAEFFDERRELLALEDMPRDLVNAFVAIEDERFYDHFGVDLRGVVRALTVNLKAGGVRQGASTISQQLPRNVLARSVGRERSIRRKIREAFIAFQIEERFSKDQILEFYLNHIFLGHNAYGVQSAAHTYFRKDARDLTLAECAALAAIPKAPSAINPISSPQRLIERRALVLENMKRQGLVTPTRADEAKKEPLPEKREVVQPRVVSPYFVDHLRRSLVEESEFEEDLLMREGYRIYSTEHPEYQRILEEEIAAGLPEVEKKWQEAKPSRLVYERRDLEKESGATAPKPGQTRLARIVEVLPDGVRVELEGYTAFVPFHKEMAPARRMDGTTEMTWTGRYVKPYYNPDLVLRRGKLIDVDVRAVSPGGEIELRLSDTHRLQGAAVLLDVQTGQILALVGGENFYDQSNDGMWNRATQAARQPGSAFKPLLYATAIQSGMTAASVVMDDRVEFSNGYVPRNYSNRYSGPTTLYEALAESNNVVTVKLFGELGFSTAFRGYRRFDMSPPQARWKMRPEMPLCLGSLNVTPLSLAAAYLPFAHQGVAVAPWCVTRVQARGERTIFMKPREERRVISTQVAYIVTRMLIEAVRHGTARTTIGDFFDWSRTPEIAGKTGTTTNCVDAWFVGYTPELALVVYVGFDRGVRSMGPQMTGSRVACPIWRETMRRILETRTDWKMEFDVPAGIVFRDIASRTGLLVPKTGLNGGEKTLAQVPFIQNTEPTEESAGYDGLPYWEYQHPDPEINRQMSEAVYWVPPSVALFPFDPTEESLPEIEPREEAPRDLLAPPWQTGDDLPPEQIPDPGM
ncbi:PBP1A family penicillin-binding protein [Candidatus Sumerlaeota bacterium]|nr:PBP1A family penicillin-binding protein [Candidatus Sumerlaeota bacterium]